ncbi:phosphohistidine phosphatase SixA [Sulfuricystis multivorans]|uniref:phosphohistidine phosphatase SixA n=1 Tax=Sulfuricystis multivorans TaxID=2211108 RepID=UPI000F8392F9|nr:phosphohistidine phosphatase SixA [Sulfuricystis multivorans]
MDLILWRHAEAEEAKAGQLDAKRRLTARGDKQAHVMAKWLRAQLPKKTRILVSPTMRTQQTAHALALPFEIEPKIGVGADAADLLAVAQWPEHSGAVLLIGHQPTLGRLAALLLSGVEADWSFKKAAVWWFTKRSREGRDQTVLRAVIHPEMLS